MNPAAKTKTAWLVALEKRGRRQKRLVDIALTRLEEARQFPNMPTHHVLGTHLGLLALANSSPDLVDIRARARWIVHWLFGYMFDQGLTVEEAASENGLVALEAIAMVAASAKQARDRQPKAVNNVLYAIRDDGHVRIAEPWQAVYTSAWKFVNALGELAR